MGKKRGEVEEHLKKVFFGGRKEDYIVFVRYRLDGEEQLRPIPGELITDVRGGYIHVGEDRIPFHRVAEIRTKKGELVYKRGL
ncbi:MAG: RNA repair domain-containing protein [Desulfurococcaceae archaeon]